ncbi:DUF4232 domain-containing protein [Kitasatospora sp. NPDC006697]|uniref:DUF4232 domain-containing protein n=1 Tax=Kitasatospora sp. NPDC006697 TaxID=3364020 RepID=UPI0036AE4032
MASVVVTIDNTGDSCTLFGFAEIEVSMNMGHTSIPHGSAQPAAVVLAKGQRATVTIWYHPNPAGRVGTKVGLMNVTPPGGTQRVSMLWPGSDLADDPDTYATTPLYQEPITRQG